ncbi:MAG TPA: DinB family protein [Chitinophagaceae bacterium]|nr:DinB family protein [Chitinophagaceae bacterium]
MTKSINQSALILSMNERLFISALDGITEIQATERISNHNNPLIWIATHTIWARYNMLALLGKPEKNPFESMFENFRPYNEADAYPTLEAVKTAWHKASVLLNDALQSVTEEVIAAAAPFKSPIGDFTNGGTIAFLTQHESYDIGQLAFLKKYYTSVAMKYN